MGFSRFIKILSIAFIVMIISGCSTNKNTESTDKQTKSEINIATCPTFWDTLYLTDLLVRETQSTSESLHLLKRGYVDYVLAGRTPKPGEFGGNYQILGSGYSFLHKQTKTIYDEELQTINFYTDLDDLENIKKIFGIKNLEKIENIYEYSNENIIITSRENTDYSKVDIVHVLHANGARYIESRIPILYCKQKCDKEVIEKIQKALNN